MANKTTAVLNQNKDFRALYYRGKSRVAPVLVTYVRKNRYGCNRVGITTGKKLGKAVERNRCRRLIREAYRLLSPSILGSWDIVFVARTRTVRASMWQVKEAMEQQLRELSLLPKKTQNHGGTTDENAAD